MTQKAIILGLLKKKPASGYDIKKFINQELGIFSNVEAQSIYYTLKKMEEEGLIERRESWDDRHLRKYVHSITAKGEKEFLNLCKELLLSQRRPFIDSDIAFYFLPFLDKKEIMPFLRLRLRFLERVKKWLAAKSEEFENEPRNLAFLIEHHFKLAEAEQDFLKKIIAVIKEGKV